MMAKFTNIGWTHVPGYQGGTWNPWEGCHPASEACANCYARALLKRWGKNPNTVRRTSRATFELPLHTYTPTAWFVNSMSDFLIEEADAWREEALEIMLTAHWHLYLILTKRIERWGEIISRWTREQDNVWFGVTAENQARWDERVPRLMQIPAAVHFVSVEPMLGPIYPAIVGAVPDWVLMGYESGPNRRPCDISTFKHLVGFFKINAVPVYVKQGSHLLPGQQGNLPDELWRVKQFPQGELPYKEN